MNRRAELASQQPGELVQSTFVWLFRDDGLNSSQAHIALNDHTSLFHDTKEQLDGSEHPPGLVDLLCSLQ